MPQGLDRISSWTSYDSSQLPSALNNNIAPVLGLGTTLRSLQARFSERVDVKDFGAVGNGITDDTAAIQAAITYASLFTPGLQIYFPNGTYLQTAPLIIRQQGVSFEGESTGGVLIQWGNVSYGFNMIFGTNHALETNNFIPTVASLVTGPGNAVLLQHGPVGGQGAFYDFMQATPLRLDGLGAFTYKHVFSLTPGDFVPGTIAYMVESNGCPQFAFNGTTAFQIQMDDQAGAGKRQCKVTMTIGGVKFTTPYIATAGVTTFVEGTTYELEVGWDGTHLYCFINGVLWTNGAYSPGTTGTINQKPWEYFGIGDGHPLYCPEEGLQTFGVGMTVDAIHISRVCRHTANYTPTGTKVVPDSGTLLAVNFDSYLNEILIAQTWNGFQRACYIYPIASASVNLNGNHIRNLSFSAGNGVLRDFVSSSEIENVIQQNCQYGWVDRGNSFLSNYQRVVIHDNGAGARWGLCLQGLSYGTVKDSDFAGPIALGVDECNIAFDNVYTGVNSNSIVSVINRLGFTTWTHYQNDFELPDALYKCCFLLDNPITAKFIDCTFSVPAGLAGAGTPAMVIFQTTGQPFTSYVEMDVCTFNTPTGQPAIISKTSPFGTTAIVTSYNPKILLNNVRNLGLGTVDDGTNFSRNVGGSASGMVGVSSTDVYCNNLNGVVAATGATTAFAVVFAKAEPDTSYVVTAFVPNTIAGTPAAGSNRLASISAKTVNGFTANLEVAPGVGNTVNFIWTIQR